MKAVIFDIDGTLVDSVDLHAKAWQDALKHFGHIIEFQRVRDQIGKGGDELLPEFLSKPEIARRGVQIKDYRSELFRAKYLSSVKPFPRVRELFEWIKSAGKKIAIGSSAEQEQLECYLTLLDVKDLVDVRTCADDTRHSKPHPDIFKVAVERLGLKPSEVIVVGDSPFDGEAASKANIESIGFLCGGFDKKLLINSGMSEIYEGPGDFLEKFETSSVVKPKI